MQTQQRDLADSFCQNDPNIGAPCGSPGGSGWKYSNLSLSCEFDRPIRCVRYCPTSFCHAHRLSPCSSLKCPNAQHMYKCIINSPVINQPQGKSTGVSNLTTWGWSADIKGGWASSGWPRGLEVIVFNTRNSSKVNFTAATSLYCFARALTDHYIYICPSQSGQLHTGFYPQNLRQTPAMIHHLSRPACACERSARLSS